MEKPSPNRWNILGMLFLVSVVTYLDRINISIAGVQIAQEFNFSQIQLGYVFSSFVLGYALFQIPGGWFGDYFGHKRILVLALVWWSVFTTLTTIIELPFLTAAFGALTTLGLVRFLIGIGEAAAFPCANGLIGNWFPPTERGTATGVLFGGIGFGSTLTPPFIGWLMTNYNWQTAFYVSGIIGLTLAVTFYFIVPEKQTPQVEHSVKKPPTPWGEILGNGQVWLLTISYFLTGYIAYIFFSWFFLYLTEVRGFSLLRGSYLASLPFAGMAIGAPLGGWLSDFLRPKLGSVRARRYVAISGLLPATLLLYVGANAENAVNAVIFLSFAAGLMSLCLSSYWATAAEIMPAHTATISGIMNTGNNFGGVLSPTLTPLIAARYGWATALAIAAVCSFIAAVLWWFIGTDKENLVDEFETK